MKFTAYISSLPVFIRIVTRSLFIHLKRPHLSFVLHLKSVCCSTQTLELELNSPHSECYLAQAWIRVFCLLLSDLPSPMLSLIKGQVC